MKKINKKDLQRLIKETINGLKSETVKMNTTEMTQKERNRIVDNLILETIKTVLLLEDTEESKGTNPEDTVGSNQRNHPYDRFLSNLFGPNLDGEGAKIPLKQAKTLIKKFVKKKIPAGREGEGEPFAEMVLGGDGNDPADKAIQLQKNESAGAASQLKPSQAEVFLDQSIDGYLTRDNGEFAKEIIGGSYDSNNSIFFSQDGYIIDGHHRTSSINGLDPACTVKGMKMNANIETCLKLLNLILEAYEDGEAKVASGQPEKSIWNTAPTPESVKAVLLETAARTSGYKPHAPWSAAENDGDAEAALNKMCEDFAAWGHGPAAQGIDKFCKSVSDNYAAWPGPETKFGARSEMPQLDDKSDEERFGDLSKSQREILYADFIEPGLKSGEYDYGRPHNYNESFDIKRWNKLAGLLKD